MALINSQTGEYLKIVSMQFDFAAGNHHVSYLIFKDLYQRQRYDAGLSLYEQPQSGQYNGFGHIENALKATNTNKATVYDELFNACYAALKADVFSGWENG